MRRSQAWLRVFAGLMFVFSHTATQPGQGATAPALRVYTSEGKGSSLDEVVAAMGAAEAVLIGETHNNEAAHRVELRLLESAHARFGAASAAAPARRVVLSLEMFERDVQPVLDEYLSGLITERHFLAASRPWKNYDADYRPLVEFARAHKLPVVAGNAPERYVNRAARLGPDSLQQLTREAKAWLAPLPYAQASPPYAAKFKRVMGGHAAAAHGNPFSLEAQALRDATMAHSIAEQLRRRGGALVLHVNGNFHSEGGLGVPEHLMKYHPGVRTLVVTILPAGAAPPADAGGFKALGDFVIVTGPGSVAP